MKPIKIIGVFIGVVSLLFLANVCYGSKVTTVVTNDSGAVVSQTSDTVAKADTGDNSTHYADFEGNVIMVTTHYLGNGAFRIKFLRNFKGIHSNLSYTIQVSDPAIVPDVSNLRIMAPRDAFCKQTLDVYCDDNNPCPDGYVFAKSTCDNTNPAGPGHLKEYYSYNYGTFYYWQPEGNCTSSCVYFERSPEAPSYAVNSISYRIFEMQDFDRPTDEGAKIQMLGSDGVWADVVGVDDSGNPSTEFEDQFDQVTAKNPSLKNQICPIMDTLKVANHYCKNVEMLGTATDAELEAAAIISPMLATHGLSDGLAALALRVHFVDNSTPIPVEWTLNQLNRWLFEQDDLTPLP